MNKIAKIRIPAEKVEAVSEVWDGWFMTDHGSPWTATLYEDDEAFIKNEQVLVIKGDSTIINPKISSIMLIITT